MRVKISKIILALVLISAFSLPKFLILAQEEETNLEELCQSTDRIEKECESLSSTECRQLLEKCGQYYEEKSAQIEEDISKTEKEKKTRQNQIYILRKKIAKLYLQIQQSNTMINDLGLQIEDTEKSINQTSLKIEDSRQNLANILQAIYQEDQKSLIEILISERTLSGFFDNLMALETLNTKSRELLENIKDLKSSLEVQEQSLDEEKTNLEKVVTIQTLQKKESESVKKDQDYFLKLTETQYQKQLKEKEETAKKAAEIRARIFELIGVPEAPTFGEALEIAKAVTSIVDIRPAFLLAIISVESAIGQNVGLCYLVNASTGEGARISNNEKTLRTMNPKRDVPIFLNITQELGRDSYHTPVSCWIPMYYKGKPYGWGGAMGPAQFIPSTWNLYAAEFKNVLKKTGDPWSIKDSFTASALYLSDLGASAKTFQKEKSAANKYSGGYSWYAGKVMKRATCIQNFIDTGSMSSDCQDEIGLK